MPKVGQDLDAAAEERKKRREENLRPWQKGYSGNPQGRPMGGLYVQQWIDELLKIDESGDPLYTGADLDRIIKDELGQEPSAKVIAAQEVFTMRAPRVKCRYIEKYRAWFIVGSDPEPGKATERVLSRLLGKPVQPIEAGPGGSVDEMMRRLSAILTANPGLERMLVQLIASRQAAGGGSGGGGQSGSMPKMVDNLAQGVHDIVERRAGA